jgi:hypothetical protein
MEIVTRKERIRRIWILVVSGIVLIGMVALSVHAKNKRDELPQLIATEKQRNADIEAKIADLESKLLAFSAPFGFRTEADVLTPEAPATPVDAKLLAEFLNMWRDRLAERYGITTYKKWAAEPDASAAGLTLPKLFDELRTLREKARQEEEAAVKESGAIDTAWKWAPGGGPDIQIPASTYTSAVLTAAKEAVEAQKKSDEEIKKLREELVNATKARDEKKLEIKTKRQALDQALKDAQVKKTEALFAASQEKQKRDVEKKELQSRLDWLELSRQEASERQETDGRVVFADASRSIAYIDIRSKDGLFRGQRFKVFSLKKGGTKKMKGEIQVIDVLADYSRCAVVKNIDRDDYMAGGDYIYDEFYDKTRKLEFAFAGHLVGPATVSQLEQKLRDYPRYRFAPKVKLETSYLVVGEGYEKDPGYVEAVKFGIRIIRERDFYAFLGLEY